jgi:hypothetical protein
MVSHHVGRVMVGERDTRACEMLITTAIVAGTIVSWRSFEVMGYKLTRPNATSAHAMPADALSSPALITATNNGGISRTTTHYPPSVVFLLSENYEQVFSKFNFPEPTTPSRRTANWRDAYNSSAQTPFRGLDEDFVNSVLEFDFFSLPSCGPSTRCASVEPQGAALAEDTEGFGFTADDTERLTRRVMTAPSLETLRNMTGLRSSSSYKVYAVRRVWHVLSRITLTSGIATVELYIDPPSE